MSRAIIGKRIATGAFAVLFAATLSFPSMAFALEKGTVDFTDIANGTVNSGEGWSYDGADTISLVNYVGGAIETVGNTVVNLEGTNSVAEGIVVSDGNLTIEGDTSVPAENKPVLNVEAQNGSAGRISTSVAPGGESSGDITIEGATVNFNNDNGMITTGESDNATVTINNSSVGVADSQEDGVFVMTYGTLNITESVVEAGHGSISSNGVMTIDNSEVTVLGEKEGDAKELITSPKGIVLKNMANGEVKGGESGPYYVDTGDSVDVKLKPQTTPGYYKGVSKTAPVAAMPQTGDSTNVVAVVASLFAVVALAAMCFSLHRKRGAHEA